MCFHTIDVLSAIAFIFVFDSSPTCFTPLPSRAIRALSGSQWWRIFWARIYKLPSALFVWPFISHHHIHISTGSSYHGPELFTLDIHHSGQWLAHQHRRLVPISSGITTLSSGNEVGHHHDDFLAFFSIWKRNLATSFGCFQSS